MLSPSDYILPKINIDGVIDTILPCLKLSKQEYEEKDKEISVILNKLGFNINDLSESTKQDLKNLFDDDEVFDIVFSGQKEHVIMNSQHLQESLVVDDELMEMELLVKKADGSLNDIKKMHCTMQRKLEAAEAHSKFLEEKCFKKAAKETIFNERVKEKEHELNRLQKITENLEQPKFSLEEVESLRVEEKKLEEEVSYIEAMLAKYHGLPLDEGAAEQMLFKLKEEVGKVENEIKMKMKDV